MNISIHNYEILNFPKENLIVSEIGVSKISSPSLLNALKTIKNRNQSNISKEEINDILVENGLDSEAAFSFMEKALLIKKSIHEYYFKKIIFIHNLNDEAVENILTSEICLPVEFHHISSTTRKLDNNSRDFIFILCKDYDYGRLKKLYFEMASTAPQSALSVGTMIGNFFCISPPYIAEIGNPCHFCNVDRLEFNDQLNPRDSSWIKLFTFFKDRNSPIPSSQHTLLQKSLIFGAVANHINFYTTSKNESCHQDSLFLTSYVDISKGLITEENLSHWFMCDCLRSTK